MPKEGAILGPIAPEPPVETTPAVIAPDPLAVIAPEPPVEIALEPPVEIESL